MAWRSQAYCLNGSGFDNDDRYFDEEPDFASDYTDNYHEDRECVWCGESSCRNMRCEAVCQCGYSPETCKCDDQVCKFCKDFETDCSCDRRICEKCHSCYCECDYEETPPPSPGKDTSEPLLSDSTSQTASHPEHIPHQTVHQVEEEEEEEEEEEWEEDCDVCSLLGKAVCECETC